MKSLFFFVFVITIIILSGCSASRKIKRPATEANSSVHNNIEIKNKVQGRTIDTKNISANEIVTFAETLIGIKYKYGAESLEDGFDCSGFVNYVFDHFNILVPRVTVDFTNVGEQVPIEESKPGDLILFTGTDEKSATVGHIGIITENNNGEVKFIHASTSRGVMISGMNSYFSPRFIKVNRLFMNEN